jgi:hypothetical protein
MGYGERELFAKEYADMNWYRGKQPKHVKEMEMGRKRSKLDIYPYHPRSRAPRSTGKDGRTETQKNG